MAVNINKIKEFLKQKHIQQALEGDSLEYVYKCFDEESGGMTHLLTNFLLSINVQPIDYVIDYLYREVYEYSDIEEITIPDTVKIIYDAAFMDCDNLHKVILEPGVKEIRQYAFESCYSLLDITIPNSVDFIDDTAFIHTSTALIIYCNENSYAHKYAMKHDIKYLFIE